MRWIFQVAASGMRIQIEALRQGARQQAAADKQAPAESTV